MLEDFLQSLFRKCGFSWFALLFCAPTFAKLRSCGASKFFLPPAGFGSTHKIERCPQTLRHAAYFLCSPVADGSKNNCDFAGFDLNGDWIFQSSHAPVKTAIIILLSFRFPTCITSQVKLCGNLGIDSCFIFKEPLASFASHAACCGPGFPGPRFRLSTFRSAVLPCRVPRQVLEEVHADILEFLAV